MKKLRYAWGRSAAAFYLYEIGNVDAILKVINRGTVKEQENIAKEIVKIINNEKETTTNHAAVEGKS